VIEEDSKSEPSKMTVYDYLRDAEWCHGFEPTDHEGCYLLITTHQQVSKAREWRDDNLEKLFTEYIPKFQNFPLSKGMLTPNEETNPISATNSEHADQLCYTPQLQPSSKLLTTNGINHPSINTRPQPPIL